MPLYTLPANTPFIAQLAQHVLQTCDPNQPRALLLLPSKRACIALSQRLGGEQGGGFKFPNIISIGEFAESQEVRAILQQHGRAHLAQPAIAAMQRQLMLARLCTAASLEFGGQPLGMEQAVELAAALASLLDEFQRQEVTLENLQDIVPDEYAEHWQRVLRFLNVIAIAWPRILADESLLDPISRRNEIYACIAEHWQASGLPSKTIIAGSTASNKAVASLMAVVAGQVDGEVILPALPLDLDAEYWQCIHPAHPNYYPKLFLDQLEKSVEDVQLLDYALPATSPASRAAFVQQSFLPSELAYRWKQAAGARYDLSGVAYVEAADDHAQARQVARMCQDLQADQACEAILIVSERRSFTKLLMATLSAAGLAFDASEGGSLRENRLVDAFRLLYLAAQQPAHPVHMLAVLKHPYFQDDAEHTARTQAEWLEQHLLRRGKLYTNVQALIHDVQELGTEDAANVAAMLEKYAAALVDFSQLLRRESAPFSMILAAHVACLEGLFAAYVEHSDAADAAELMEFLQSLKAGASMLGEVDSQAYEAILERLLGQKTNPQASEAPATIRILPSEEARLETADAVIVVDFNEGVWPAATAANPWLSRTMQQQIGLDLDHIRAGRMAHDLMMLAHAKHIILTRSRSDATAELVPSRFQQRMAFHLMAIGQIGAVEEFAAYRVEAEQPQAIEPDQVASRPAPTPPIASRPTRLSVSDMELLLRDPYSIYAKHILKLKPLEELIPENTQAMYGMVLHKVLELFCSQHPQHLPPDGLAQLEVIAHQVLVQFEVDKNLHALWLPKLKATFEKYLDVEHARRPMLGQVEAEVKLAVTLPASGVVHHIYGRMDRVEHYQDGTLGLVDYKTGTLPISRQVKEMIACQLPLGAWLLSEQYQKQGKPHQISAAEYWRLGNKELLVKPEPSAAGDVAATKAHFTELLANYQQPQTAYTCQPDPSIAPAYPAYNQLARYAEWV